MFEFCSDSGTCLVTVTWWPVRSVLCCWLSPLPLVSPSLHLLTGWDCMALLPSWFALGGVTRSKMKTLSLSKECPYFVRCLCSGLFLREGRGGCEMRGVH